MGSGASSKLTEEQMVDFNKASNARMNQKDKFSGTEEERQQLIKDALAKLDVYSKSLNDVQAAIYREKMQVEFEKFEGDDDKDHELFMINAHDRIVGSLAPSVPAAAISSRSVRKVKGAATRRRSYGEQPGANAIYNGVRKRSAEGGDKPSKSASVPVLPDGAEGAVADAVDGIVKSESVAEIVTTETDTKIDSWDSVIDQPFCTTCQMAFKTATALKRHENYSDLHAKQVAKIKDKDKDNNSEGAANSPLKITPATQEAQLLYSGSKLFYKTGDSLEFSFYYQGLLDCVEVCARHQDDNELNRLYMCHSKIMLNIEQTVLEAVAKRRKEQAKMSAKRASFEIDLESEVDAARLLALSSFLLARLQQAPQTDMNTPTGIVYVAMANDNPAMSPLLAAMPGQWAPVVTTRRRRATAEEVDNTLTTLNTDYAALTAATDRAGKIANVVFEGVNMLKSNVKYGENLNPLRKKWIWAIKRVVRQRLVADTTKVLTSMAAAKEKPGIAASAGAKVRGSF